MSGLLDLSGADTSGGDFEALPSGTYSATIFEVTMKETKGGEGSKLPAGTPYFNVQFRLDADSGYENRRAFTKYMVAPSELPDGSKYEHKAKLDGMLVRFFESIGYSEEEVRSGSFNPPLEEMSGRPCRVVLSRKIKFGTKPEDGEYDNEVVGIKPPAIAESAGIL